MVIIWLMIIMIIIILIGGYYGYYMVNDNNDNILVGGFEPTPLKNDGVKASWDDEIPFPIDGQS